MPTPYKSFPALLYYHLIHSGKHDLGEVAKKMTISASALYKYAEGDLNFPPDLIAPLYNATGCREFLDFFLKDTDQRLAPRIEAPADDRALTMETLDVVHQVGELSGHVQQAVEDGKLSDIERAQIERVVSRLHQELEHVRIKVRNGRAA